MSLRAQDLRVAIVGDDSPYNLEGSYMRALRARGCQVHRFDLHGVVAKHIRLSHLGKLLNRFVPIEPWVRKANRELFIAMCELAPDVVVISGAAPVRVGALAQLKISRPDTRIVLLWPDPLYNLESHTLEILPMCDIVGTYSRESMAYFERLGAPQALWLPFAADFDIHSPDVTVSAADRARFSCDAIFIGARRPEREQAVLALLDAGIDVQVWGTAWRRYATEPKRVDEYFHDEALRGADFVKASRCAKVCLNIMDPGNYPGANMRFFENCTSGSPTVSSPCPELEQVFVDGETIVYSEPDAMSASVQALLGDAARRDEIAKAALALVSQGHTYHDRARTLLEALEVDSG